MLFKNLIGSITYCKTSSPMKTRTPMLKQKDTKLLSTSSQRKTLNMLRQRSPLNIDSHVGTFIILKKKNGPLISSAHMEHQIVTFSGCIGSSCTTCGFSSPQIRQFCLFTKPLRWKCASFLKIILFWNASSTSVVPSVVPISSWQSFCAVYDRLASALVSTVFCRHEDANQLSKFVLAYCD